MTIYNTTYTVHTAAIDRWLHYARTTLIPSLVADGFTSPLLMQVDCTVDPDYRNFALQLSAPDRRALDRWIAADKPDYDHDTRRLFGEQVLSFSTIMNPLALL